MPALRCYYSFYGDLSIPQSLIVPEDDNQWPAEFSNLQLGQILTNIKSRKPTLSDKRLCQLKKLGLFFNRFNIIVQIILILYIFS